MVLRCPYALCPLLQLNSVFSGGVDPLLPMCLLAQHFYHKGLLRVLLEKETAGLETTHSLAVLSLLQRLCSGLCSCQSPPSMQILQIYVPVTKSQVC